MHCYICDSMLEKPEFDSRFNPIKIDPCPSCLEAIYKAANLQEDDDFEIVEEGFDDEDL